GSSPGAKGLFTDLAPISLSLAILKRDVAPSDSTSCGAHGVWAKLVRRFHWLSCDVVHIHIMPMGPDFFKPSHFTWGFPKFPLTDSNICAIIAHSLETAGAYLYENHR